MPTFQLAYQGDAAVFICYSRIKPVWLKGDTIIQMYETRGNALIIPDVSSYHNAEYRCRGEWKNGTEFTSPPAKLLVGSK